VSSLLGCDSIAM